jgi:hypothetical protein
MTDKTRNHACIRVQMTPLRHRFSLPERIPSTEVSQKAVSFINDSENAASEPGACI